VHSSIRGRLVDSYTMESLNGRGMNLHGWEEVISTTTTWMLTCGWAIHCILWGPLWRWRSSDVYV